MTQTAQQKVLQFKKRGKGKYLADLKSDDLYEYYCEKYGNTHNISKSRFLKILKELNDAKIECIVGSAWTYRMPCRLGDFRVRKRKLKFKLDENGELSTANLKVDYKATKELWASDKDAMDNKRLIFHFNEHTDGYNFPWYWDKRTSNVKNKFYYKVVMTRTHNRYKADLLINNHNLDYFE